mmetsp:Transcript_8796/g.9312  ORF Transcript_8796/g.9312 Transcript_8796/m.9312 type:complete len:142 (+) Transcript_8796:28-453(+)
MSNIRFSKPLWHLVDAKDKIVGRLATKISHILRGKHKPNFSPNYDCGDYVVVINAQYVKFTGAKETKFKYRWHTGYPGGLKEMTPEVLRQHKPEEIIRHAVLGMLPKNSLRRRQSLKLRIFPGSKHLHYDVLPEGSPSIIS